MAAMKKARKGQEIPDLRYASDESARILGGMIYRKGCVVQVCHDNGSVETWWLTPSDEARRITKEFFDEKKAELE